MLKQSFLALLLLTLCTAGTNAFEVTIDNFSSTKPANSTVFSKTLVGDNYTITRSFSTSNLTGFEAVGDGNFNMTYAGGTPTSSQGSVTYNVLKNGGATNWQELFNAERENAGFSDPYLDYAVDAWRLDLLQIQQFGGINDVSLQVSAGGSVLFDNSASPFTARSASDPFEIRDVVFGSASNLTYDFNINAGAGAFTVVTVGTNLVMTPEPASLALFGSLLGAVTIRRRRR
ncbi:MAG: PEP-CTERM sorting domain-containing protein [Planctomycetaceae bacterium]|nr:PEP-CTERM sorting domain-containing protein [Planctomycetaceae bacterium]